MKKGKEQQKSTQKTKVLQIKDEIRLSHPKNELYKRNSIISRNSHEEMIPILTTDEINKLEALKRESIYPKRHEENGRESIRPNNRGSVRQSHRQSKNHSGHKTKVKRKHHFDDSHKDEIDTKKTDETGISFKGIKQKKEKAVQEKQQGGLDKCCDLLKKEEKVEQNPFRRARQSYLKN